MLNENIILVLAILVMGLIGILGYVCLVIFYAITKNIEKQEMLKRVKFKEIILWPFVGWDYFNRRRKWNKRKH